jgi:hypothetical protein
MTKEEIDKETITKIKNTINNIESKLIRDRTEYEHLFLIRWKYKNSVRNYLLSMGAFKD